MAPTVASSEGYFSSNLESMRKDVECTFGMLKKMWKILNNGLLYRNIKICENFFVAAVCLHNMLVDSMVVNYKDARVGRGAPLKNGGMPHKTHKSFWQIKLFLQYQFYVTVVCLPY